MALVGYTQQRQCRELWGPQGEKTRIILIIFRLRCSNQRKLVEMLDCIKSLLAFTWNIFKSISQYEAASASTLGECGAGSWVWSWDLGMELGSGCGSGIWMWIWDLSEDLGSECGAGIWVQSWDLSVKLGAGCGAGM